MGVGSLSGFLGYFLVLISLLSSNLFAVSALKRPQGFFQPGTVVLGQFLLGMAVQKCCSHFHAKPALTGIRRCGCAR